MPDALILGGGLAGSAATLLLAGAGKNVRLVEREGGAHHKICGEFLSVEAYQHLIELGVDVMQMGAAAIDKIQIVSDRHMVEAALPFAAFGLSRFRLDEALIERAAAAGATIERGVRVLSLEDGYIRTSAGDREGEQILLATGKHPVRNDVAERASDDNPFVGFKMHYRLSSAARSQFDRVIRLILFDGGYAGLQQIEEEQANLCLVVRRERLMALGGNWGEVVSMLGALHHCGEILADAEPLFPRPITIANLAYGPARRNHQPDAIFRLGDQAGMTASLTGDGMAIALRSAFIAAHCLKEGLGAEDYRARHRKETLRQMRCAMALQHMQEMPVLRSVGMGMLLKWPELMRYAARATRLRE